MNWGGGVGVAAAGFLRRAWVWIHWEEVRVWRRRRDSGGERGCGCIGEEVRRWRRRHQAC